ncbi:hypothetical protein NC651_040004 [Populus alba x Populus x berolinensis]|nr:hypothetical protein NC651_040004 [Populus alba x Populus x berolinensis]
MLERSPGQIRLSTSRIKNACFA